VRSIAQTTPVMGAPMWLAYLAMPVGSVLMGLRTVQSLYRMRRERAPEGAHLMDLQD
jgi:TRAP-type C4-dicarboxylate transport system permease small subunit